MFKEKKKLKWYHWLGIALAVALSAYFVLVVIAFVAITRALTRVDASAPRWERLKLGFRHPFGGGGDIARQAVARTRAFAETGQEDPAAKAATPCGCTETANEARG